MQHASNRAAGIGLSTTNIQSRTGSTDVLFWEMI
jgi:hypothetical protein